MEIVAKAKQLTDRILEMTKQVSLTGEPQKVEEEVAAYVELIERRGPLVKELAAFDFDEKTRSSNEFLPVKETIAAISELDKEHMEIVQDMHESIKDAIRLAKQGQRLNKGYQASHQDSFSSGFDVKQ